MTPSDKISIILPTYNEAANIVELVQRITETIPEHYKYEIVIVDDNSPDGTFQLIERVFKNHPDIKPILRTRDRGFAKSIRAGIEHSQGDQILVMDTDFTHNPAYIPVMLHVAKAYDIVISSRFCAGGRMEDRCHYLISLLYNWFIRVIIGTQIQDNLGGYFAINKRKLDLLPFDPIFYGFGDYFFRLLYYAQKKKIAIIEIPVVYDLRRKGKKKSHSLNMLISYTVSLFKLKLMGS